MLRLRLFHTLAAFCRVFVVKVTSVSGSPCSWKVLASTWYRSVVLPWYTSQHGMICPQCGSSMLTLMAGGLLDSFTELQMGSLVCSCVKQTYRASDFWSSSTIILACWLGSCLVHLTLVPHQPVSSWSRLSLKRNAVLKTSFKNDCKDIMFYTSQSKTIDLCGRWGWAWGKWSVMVAVAGICWILFNRLTDP